MIDTAINLLSVIPMRKEPAHRSEMVSQLLFGEYAEVLEEESDFVKVKCLYDGYGGWVQANQLIRVQREQVLSTNEYIGVHDSEVLVNDRRLKMPFGVPIYCSVPPANHIKFGTAQVSYLVSEGAVWNAGQNNFNQKNLDAIIRMFLDVPYLWGGKSIYGIDCSGFVQQAFKMFGITLLRDAYLQAEQGTVVKTVEEAQFGDLAFFHNEKGRVVHVGIVLDGAKIVHASGKVRIDAIDKEGIMNSEAGKRTHQLHSIKRVL